VSQNWNIPAKLPRFLTKHSYRVEKRGRDDRMQRLNDKDPLVIVWRKGYAGYFHFKCDGPSLSGDWIESLGDTVEECLKEWAYWAQQ
jgi:hypothetical protein